MMDSNTVPKIPNIFGNVHEDNVVFCIDTSGSMHSALPVVKLHLQETLCTMAADKKKKFFNIIEFNSNVTAWADKLICNTRETAALAMEWVGHLNAKTGTNTLGVLRSAFSNPQVDAIYLVTDSLPEQHRNDILDEAVYLSNGRPVHCICITDSVPETGLTDFLEDLAVETFGSLHVVQVSTHGYVERVTHIYSADHGPGKMLTTSSGGRYMPQKSCSLTSTLQLDPDYWKGYPYLPCPSFHPILYDSLTWPYYPFVWPSRYPYGPRGWSRFFPAKSWLKDKRNEIAASLSPGAGAILIGKKVLARRHEDGLFYLGTVQSQILLNQFLVAFGPCKHGDFMDTTYQETNVFDIIDYNEAERHSILTGDYVLAPWEPEGEKFRPGKVLHGQETRQSEPRSKDAKLTISFDNGVVANIKPDVVVWIPKEFYERVKLELQMTPSARRYVQGQDGYPRISKPGYPSSGPRPSPKYYPCVNPLSLRQPSFALTNGRFLSSPFGFVPISTVYPAAGNFLVDADGSNRFEGDIAHTSKEIESQVIPGTNLSVKELNEKVDSQITEHKKGMDALAKRRTLNMKEKQDGKRSLHPSPDRDHNIKEDEDKSDYENIHRKQDADFDEYKDNDWCPSGKDVLAASDLENSPDLGFYDDFGIDDLTPRPSTKDIGINTEFSESKKTSKYQPPWKYWHSDPIPPLLKSPSKVGPFRETMLQVPLELRDKFQPPEPAEWSSCMFNYVDRFAQHRHKDSVKELLKTPKPPTTALHTNRQLLRDTQTPQHLTDEEKAIARQNSRRQAVLARESAWKQKVEKAENLTKTKEDARREKILRRIMSDNHSFKEEQRQVQATCDAKTQLNAEIQNAFGAKQQREWQHEDKRMKAKHAKRELRDKEYASKFFKTQEDEAAKKQIQFERNQQHWAETYNRLAREEAEANVRIQRAQRAKLRQIRYFERREKENQDKKLKNDNNAEQQLAIYRSRVFP